MNILVKSVAAIAAFSFFASPSISGELSPLGKWQTTSGESRYEVVQCGYVGQLCAKLTWLRSDARTAENLKYLNKYVVLGARQTGTNRWKGAVRYNGDTFGGSMVLVSPQRLKLNGCKVIFCQSIEFDRI